MHRLEHAALCSPQDWCVSDDDVQVVVAPPRTLQTLRALRPTNRRSSAGLGESCSPSAQMESQNQSTPLEDQHFRSSSCEPPTWNSTGSGGSLQSVLENEELNVDVPAVKGELPTVFEFGDRGDKGKKTCTFHDALGSDHKSEHSTTSASPHVLRRPHKAAKTALRYLGLLSSGPTAAPANGDKNLAHEDACIALLEFCFAVCTSNALDFATFVAATTLNDRKSLRRLTDVAIRTGLISAAQRRQAAPPLSELTRAFLSTAGDAIPLPRQFAGGRSSSSIGTVGRRTDLNRTLSNFSNTSFSDFNRRSMSFRIPPGSRPNTSAPTFFEFFTSLDSNPEKPFSEGPVHTDAHNLVALHRQNSQTVDAAMSDAGVTYHSVSDVLLPSDGEETDLVQAEVANVGAADGSGKSMVRIGFKSKCLRTHNEWQRQLLAQQRTLLGLVSNKLQAAEQALQVGNCVEDDQRELLRGFRKIITRKVGTDEGQRGVAIIVVEKRAEAREEVEELCRILEYPCKAFNSLTVAKSALCDELGFCPPPACGASPPAPNACQKPARRNTELKYDLASLLEGRARGEHDWRSWSIGTCGATKEDDVRRSTSHVSAAPPPVTSRVVLIGAAWLGHDLPQEWQAESVFVVLVSRADEFEDVGRALFASGENEIRERLRSRGISSYLMYPLSLDSLRSVATEAIGQRFADDYLLLEAVGRGTSGVVHMAKRMRDGAAFALKEINLRRLNKTARMDVVRESKLLQEVRWPTVVFVVDAWEKDQLRYLLMPLMEGGNLMQRAENAAKEGRRIERQLIRDWYAQTLHGLSYLHWRGVLHRDLKPANLLLASDNRSLQIGDLGSAELLPGLGPHPARASWVRGAVCTPLYTAPEVSIEGKYFSTTDLWAVGATFFELLTLQTLIKTEANLQDFVGSELAAEELQRRITTSVSAAGDGAECEAPGNELHELLRPSPMQRPLASELAGRPRTMRCLRTVMAEVGVLPDPYAQKAHFNEYCRVLKESKEGADV